MKKIRKLISVSFILAMVSMFAACGRSDADGTTNDVDGTTESETINDVNDVNTDNVRDNVDIPADTDIQDNNNDGSVLEDVGDTVGDVVDDVTDGVDNVTEDVIGGSEDKVNDATTGEMDRVDTTDSTVTQ